MQVATLFDHQIVPGASVAHKIELPSGGGPYNKKRLYLIPFLARGVTKFDKYDCDFYLSGGTISYKFGVYRQVSNLTNTGVCAFLMPGTSITVTGATTNFQVVPIGATACIEPGYYWIGFIFDVTAGAPSLTTLNSLKSASWIKGRWVYNDPGSLSLPSTINGSSLSYICATASENPFWCAITYSGDTYP